MKQYNTTNIIRKSMGTFFAIATAISISVVSACPAQDVYIPEFEEHKVKVSKITPKKINFRGDPQPWKYRTRLREANKEGINFAGHYIIASWGCGTGCSIGAIIDAKTGEVFFPDELAGGFGIETGHPEESLDKYGNFEYKPESNLLVLNGWGGEKNGVRYLLWENNQFRLKKFIPIPLHDDNYFDEAPVEPTDVTHQGVGEARWNSSAIVDSHVEAAIA